jgi:hypothetical protein
MNQHQLETHYLLCLLGVNVSTCFGRYSPTFRRRFHPNLHVVNTHPMHVITPNSICAQPPEDGRVTPETCRGIEQTKKSVSSWY